MESLSCRAWVREEKDKEEGGVFWRVWMAREGLEDAWVWCRRLEEVKNDWREEEGSTVDGDRLMRECTVRQRLGKDWVW